MGIIEEIVFLECCEHQIILIQLLQTSDLWPEKSNCLVIANGYHCVRFSWTAGLSCLSWKLLTTMWSLWLPGVFRCSDTFRNLSGSTHSGGHCPSTLWESERSRESRGWEVKDERRWGDYINKATWSHPGSRQTERLPHDSGRRGIYTVRLLATIMIKVHISLEKSLFIFYVFLIRETQ